MKAATIAAIGKTTMPTMTSTESQVVNSFKLPGRLSNSQTPRGTNTSVHQRPFKAATAAAATGDPTIKPTIHRPRFQLQDSPRIPGTALAVAVTQVSQTPIHAARILIIHRACNRERRFTMQSPPWADSQFPPILQQYLGEHRKARRCGHRKQAYGCRSGAAQAIDRKVDHKTVVDTEISAIGQSGPIVEPDIYKLAACGTSSGCKPTREKTVLPKRQRDRRAADFGVPARSPG